MNKRYYVGIRNIGARELFACDHDPTSGNPGDSQGAPYVCVIGPHKTRRGAQFMASWRAIGNPHVQCARDADRIARELHLRGEAI